MGPLIPILGALAALGVGYKVMTKPRYVGDLAKAGPVGTGPSSGDQVEVMVPDLIRSNSSFSVGTNPGQIPPGTNTVIVAVLGASKDVLQGPITTMGTIPLGAPLGAVVVNRRDVKAVFRNGKTARQIDGAAGSASSYSKFAGEREKRFAG